MDRQTYIDWYTLMLRIRKFEEKAGQLFGQQKIRGFCHLYIGQEAVAAGTVSAMDASDSMITAYRDHGLAIAKGITTKSAMAELFGKQTGCSKGKGGSMHFFSKAHAFFGGHGIVGGHIPIGAGIAFAEKYKGTKNVCVCFFGDGASRQGALHETFNMAMMWKLPIVFAVENNGYAMGTSVERSSNITDLYKLGLSYDIPSEAVDGMNCLSVHQSMSKAIARARGGQGPSFLEVKTYRYKGHSMSDPAKYRTKEEVAAYKKQDPILQVLDVIKENKYLKESDIKEIQEKVQKEINECITFAEQSDYPPNSDLYQDIYMQKDYPFIMD